MNAPFPASDPGALSPLDGRYARRVEPFAKALSEEALSRQRFTVEVEWFLALAAEPGIGELPPVPAETADVLKGWVADFGPDDVTRIKVIEGRINHDVKAVEYLLKEKLAAIGFGSAAEFVHFACTSEDINNIAHALMLREGLATGWLPLADALVDEVGRQAAEHARLPMPSHTHGQPASPTTLGKELAVFAARWDRQLRALRDLPLLAKFTFHGGAGLYSWFMVAMGAGAVLGGLATAFRSQPTTKLLACIGVVFGCAILAVSLAPTSSVAIALLVPMGAASISFVATNNATLQLRADPAMRGRVMALNAIAFLGSTPIGAPLLGYVSDVSTPRVALALGGVATLVASVPLFALHARRVRVAADAAMRRPMAVAPGDPELGEVVPLPIGDARPEQRDRRTS